MQSERKRLETVIKTEEEESSADEHGINIEEFCTTGGDGLEC